MARTTSILACAVALAVVVDLHATQDSAKADAARMRTKLTAIAQRGNTPPKKAARGGEPPALTTSFTEKEANAYFKVNGPEFLPAGLENPEVTIEDGGHVRGRAVVDLDVVLKTRQRSMLDPLSWLTGKTEIAAAGVVHGESGKGTLLLESATLSGIPVPKTLLQQIVNYYTRTPEKPDGIDIDKPFDLPSNIRSIDVRRGQATVVQP